MQKSLAFLLNSFSNFFLKKYDVTTSFYIYLKAIALIFFISIFSILYQFNDLSVLENSTTAYNASIYFNVFKWVPLSFAKPLLWIGLSTSITLFFLILPFWMILINAIVYSSITLYFPTFLSFQWDTLLIETLLVTLLFISPKIIKIQKKDPWLIPYAQLLPVILLVIRLFFHSGVVKLISNDPLWLSQNALNIHFYSQPFPHLLSYYTHRFVVFNNLSIVLTQLMFIIELIVPFGLLSNTYRKISASILILFQITIIFTGNYGYFNFLTIALLCIPLLIKETEKLVLPIEKIQFPKTIKQSMITNASLMAVFSIIIINGITIIHYPRSNVLMFESVFENLMVFNKFGLFARMTHNQTKFTINVSNNGVDWENIKLKYFDSSGYPTLRFIQPYHPRIRWQLWFKFINHQQYPTWYIKFIEAISKNSHNFPSILKNNNQLKKTYRLIKLCYQDITFNLNQPSQIWNDQYNKSCHIYNTHKKRFSILH